MEQIEKLIETRTKAIDDASEMLSGLKLVDTNALEFNCGGSMYKHLNIPEEKPKDRTDPETSNVLGILASKEVPDKTSFEEYQLEFAQKFDIRPSIESKNDLQNAPFKQIKRTEMTYGGFRSRTLTVYRTDEQQMPTLKICKQVKANAKTI